MDSSVIDTPSTDAAIGTNDTDAAPMVVTPTHVYMALPVARWSAAYHFITDTVGPDTPVEDDPESTTILAAINRTTYAVEGVLFVNRVILAQHFHTSPVSGVDFAAFDELLRLHLPSGTVYYAEARDGIGGVPTLEAVGELLRGTVDGVGASVGVEGGSGDDSTGSVDSLGSDDGSGSDPS